VNPRTRPSLSSTRSGTPRRAHRVSLHSRHELSYDIYPLQYCHQQAASSQAPQSFWHCATWEVINAVLSAVEEFMCCNNAKPPVSCSNTEVTTPVSVPYFLEGLSVSMPPYCPATVKSIITFQLHSLKWVATKVASEVFPQSSRSCGYRDLHSSFTMQACQTTSVSITECRLVPQSPKPMSRLRHSCAPQPPMSRHWHLEMLMRWMHMMKKKVVVTVRRRRRDRERRSLLPLKCKWFFWSSSPEIPYSELGDTSLERGRNITALQWYHYPGKDLGHG